MTLPPDSEDWHTPIASNNLKVGGRFNYRMESKDGSEGFDFDGTYTEVVLNEKISYTMDDPSSHEASNGHSGRKVETIFEDMGTSTKVITTFDPESENPPEFQKAGWQAILDNFKKYAEENK